MRERRDSTALEFEFGRVWLVRIGIVMLLTGLVFLGNLAYQHIVPRLGPGMKLGLIVAAGGALAGIGGWLEKRHESLRNYGRVLLAGGFAAIYYACYAAHFVRALRLIESAVLGGALLLAFAGGVAWFAHRRRSETLASLAILLSYYTSCINPVGGFTLFSSAILTAAAVFFLVKNRWTKITYLSVAATYASYTYWRFLGGDSAATAAWVQVAFLACYWLLFTAAAFLTDRSAMNAVRRTSFVTANNAAFFALAAHAIAADGGGKFWLFALAYGGVLLVLSKLAALRDPEDRTLDTAYLTQGLALTTTGLATHLTGQQLALTFAAQGTVLLSCGRARQGRLLEIGGMLSLGAAFLLALGGLLLVAGPHSVATAGIAALVLFFNAWSFKRQRGLNSSALHPVASALAGAAFILGIGWLEKIAGAHTAAGMGGVALALAFVPFAEFALLAQALLPFAVVKWAGAFLPAVAELLADRTLSHGQLMPLDSTILLTCGVVLAHWWSRVKRFDPALRMVAEAFAALSSVAVALIWMRRGIPGTDGMTAASLLGIAWILAARCTRARFLSYAGLAFTLSAVADFARLQAAAHWAVALFPVVNVAALGWVFRRHEIAGLKIAPLGIPVAAVMLLCWSWSHVPAPWLTLFYAATAGAIALIGARRSEVWLSATALALGALATVLFWSRIGIAGQWRNVAALMIFASACRLSRKLWPADPMLAAASTVAWSTVAGITAWVASHHTVPSLTIAWSVLAFAFFVAGLALRDRHYRLGGLTLLGLSVARVFFVDVWAFEAVWRILSFIVLGVVLLIVGYAYNRFEEKLRQWL